MKKFISLKLIVFSFILVAGSVSFSADAEFKKENGTDSIIAGISNEASGNESSAFGYKNKATEEKSSAFGHSNEASGKFSSAFGYKNIASSLRSSAFGVGNKASGEQSSAFGFLNKASGGKSSVFGSQYEVTGNSSGAFGVGEYNGSYQYKNEGNNSYMIGNKNKIASGSNDNFILGNNVHIGGGINNSVALGNNSTVSASNTVSVGSSTLKRKIVNVGDGEISATSTDAVTGKQLYKVMQNSGTTGIENLRNEVNEKIDDVKNEVNHVGSLSAALAGLHPMQYDPKAPAQVMAALGHYRNKQSVAVGLSYYFNDRFMMSAGVAIGSEKRVKSMANVGFTVKLGKGSGVTYNEAPQYAIQDEVKRLTVENNKQAKENQELKERVKKLEEKLEVLLKNK